MKEYRIQADAGKELTVSRWPDGRYSIKVFSSSGNMAAHLILGSGEGGKFSDVMWELVNQGRTSPPPPRPTPGQVPMSDYP